MSSDTIIAIKPSGRVVDVHCSFDKIVDINDVVPYPNNANRHSEGQISLLARLIGGDGEKRGHGWRVPITVSNQSGFVVRGHGRLIVAKKLGMNQVPVDYQDYESKEMEKADRLADNQVPTLAEFDAELLKEEIEALSAVDFDMELTGFESSYIKEILALDDVGGVDGDDEPSDPPDDPITVMGDIWTLGEHRLICGDCTDPDVVGRLMGGEKADMVFTDPPYGIAIVKSKQIGGGGATKFGKVGGEKIVQSNTYKVIEGDDTTDAARAAYKVAINMGVETIIIWGGNYFTDFLPPSPCWIVWDKENTGNFADVEMAWVNQNRGAKLYRWLWNGLSRRGARSMELKARVHPTQKPVGLFVKIFEDFQGDTVLDFFLGSGSTMIACEKTDRRCFGGEIDPGYCDVILRRWADFAGCDPVRDQDGKKWTDLTAIKAPPQ